MQEKLNILGKELSIDTSDWFGKYILLQSVLQGMEEEEANKFMTDTLMMLSDEIDGLIEEIV